MTITVHTSFFFFFFNDTATTEIYTLSLHDALPILVVKTNYYAISDSKGKVAIPSVPPGRYLLDLWYERSLPEALKAFPREVTVSEIGDSIGTIRLIESGDLMPSHKNKYGRDYDKPTPAGPL